ncbi:hypothetical protein I4U23_016723 [Adineta vaga]|nr:hypothetical protein I4U23_016723 [Adineta vaga]
MATITNSYRPLANETLETTSAATTLESNNDITFIWVYEETIDPISISSTYDNLIIKFKDMKYANHESYTKLDKFIEEMENWLKPKEIIIVIMSGSVAENMRWNQKSTLLRKISALFIFTSNYSKCKHLWHIIGKLVEVCTTQSSLEQVIRNELISPTYFEIKGQKYKFMFSLTDDYKLFIWYTNMIKVCKDDPHFYPKDGKETMLSDCMKCYSENNAQMEQIQKFRDDYNSSQAITWYKRECFLYHCLNTALRSPEIQQICPYGFVINDLHERLRELNGKAQSKKSIIVYRGVKYTNKLDFSEVENNIGKLVAFSGFLSSSKDFEVAKIFAGCESKGGVSVIFEIKTDYAFKNVVFADISDRGEDEQEVLFSVCTVFLLNKIEYRVEDNIQIVKLKVVNDNISKLAKLFASETPQIDAKSNNNNPQPTDTKQNTTTDNSSQYVAETVQNTANYPLSLVHKLASVPGWKLGIIAFTVIFVAASICLPNSHNCIGLNCTVTNPETVPNTSISITTESVTTMSTITSTESTTLTTMLESGE